MEYSECTGCPTKEFNELTGHCRRCGKFYIDIEKCDNYPRDDLPQ